MGTTAKIAAWIQKLRPDLNVPQENDKVAGDIYVAYCPERVLPGKVIQELVQNDRIIGGLTTFGADKAAKFYQLFVKGECIKTKARAAAMCKLAENSYRDVNIAFANELSMICDEQGIDVWELLALANRHPRVNILKPGPGVGGHCIAVDPWFIVDAAPKVAKIIRTAREVNDYKSDYVVDRVIASVKAEEFKQVIFWGLSYKPDIDDLRESPAVRIVVKFSKVMTHVQVNVVEPHIDQLSVSLKTLHNVCLVEADLAETNSVALHVFLVSHKKFNCIGRGSFRNLLNFCGIVREETTAVGMV